MSVRAAIRWFRADPRSETHWLSRTGRETQPPSIRSQTSSPIPMSAFSSSCRGSMTRCGSTATPPWSRTLPFLRTWPFNDRLPRLAIVVKVKEVSCIAPRRSGARICGTEAFSGPHHHAVAVEDHHGPDDRRPRAKRNSARSMRGLRPITRRRCTEPNSVQRIPSGADPELRTNQIRHQQDFPLRCLAVAKKVHRNSAMARLRWRCGLADGGEGRDMKPESGTSSKPVTEKSRGCL